VQGKPDVSFYNLTFYRGALSIFSHIPTTEENVVFVGDSQVARGHWPEFFRSGRVQNRGISGDDTRGVTRRIGSIARGRPEAIFIDIGSNDIHNRVPIPDVINSFGKILDTLQTVSPGTNTYVLSILPAGRQEPEARLDNKLIRALNQEIRKLVRERSGEQLVAYIDVATQLADEQGFLPDEYTLDGAHLNGPGTKRLIEILKPSVHPHL